MSTEFVERRHYPRLRYAEGDRLHIAVEGRVYPLREISEHGVVFYGMNGRRFVLGEPISATVMLRDGRSLSVQGMVLRTRRDEVVAYLRQGIAAEVITHEQAHLCCRD